MRRKARKDNNHNDVVDVMRAITSVVDLSGAGDGVPDILVRVGDGWQLADIKNLETAYGRKGLNETQKEWAIRSGGPVYLLHTVEEAIRFAKGDFAGIDHFPRQDGKMSAADLLALQKKAPKPVKAQGQKAKPKTPEQRGGGRPT
jgi:hypothetical protein